MPMEVEMMAGVFMDIKGAMGDLVFRHMPEGGVEVFHRSKFRNPPVTPYNFPQRAAYAYCDDRWRTLPQRKRETWFRKKWRKGLCAHSGFMMHNMRRVLCGLPILCKAPPRVYTGKSWGAPWDVSKEWWYEDRDWDCLGWSIGDDGKDFVLGDPAGHHRRGPMDKMRWIPTWMWQVAGEPPELLTFRTYIHTTEGFVVEQDEMDGIFITEAVQGVSVMVDGLLVAYRGDSEEGYECVQPCGPIAFGEQSFHDIIVCVFTGPKTQFRIQTSWENETFREWVKTRGIDWWGIIRDKGKGLCADWPQYHVSVFGNNCLGKARVSAVAGADAATRRVRGRSAWIQFPFGEWITSKEMPVEELAKTFLKDGLVVGRVCGPTLWRPVLFFDVDVEKVVREGEGPVGKVTLRHFGGPDAPGWPDTFWMEAYVYNFDKERYEYFYRHPIAEGFDLRYMFSKKMDKYISKDGIMGFAFAGQNDWRIREGCAVWTDFLECTVCWDAEELSILIPLVELSAPTEIGERCARLHGKVVDPGNEDVEVVVYWGETDGFQEPGAWEHSSAPTSPEQPQGHGAFYKDLAGLSPGTEYWFSASAINSAGRGWPLESRAFRTAEEVVYADWEQVLGACIVGRFDEIYLGPEWPSGWVAVKVSDDERWVWNCEELFPTRSPGQRFTWKGVARAGLEELIVEHEGFGAGGVSGPAGLLEGYLGNFVTGGWDLIFSHSSGADVFKRVVVSDSPGRYVSAYGLVRLLVVGPVPEEGGAVPEVATDFVGLVAVYE